jgi:hypothetical protein
VKDTGFLTYDFADPDRDDDQWLYLPALKKSKRIATADKSGSFVGSDFSYADLTKRPLERYDYQLLEAGEQGGVPVWFVEAVPNHPSEIDETGYTKVRYAVRQDNAVVVGAVFTLRRGGREKHYTVTKLEQIDGIWVPTSMQMATAKGDVRLHETRLDLSHVRFGQPMDDSRFSVRQLEKGLGWPATGQRLLARSLLPRAPQRSPPQERAGRRWWRFGRGGRHHHGAYQDHH